MNKYTILIILNMPFVIFGLLKTFSKFRAGGLSPLSLLLRLGFWAALGLGILFAQNIYEFLTVHALTDTAPLSLADVILVTGVSFALYLILRLYSKQELLEKRLVALHEKLSITLSAPSVDKQTPSAAAPKKRLPK